MARLSGVSAGGLVLPPAYEKYDAANETETRRLIVQAMRALPQWDSLTNIPANVTSLGGLVGAADMVPYFTGISVLALASLTPYARTILAAASASAARTVLGLGGLAVLNAVTEALITLADNTTDNVTSTAHGFAPKSPADATKFLNGAATPAYALVKDSDLALTNVTSNDVSITKHGFTPIAPNDTTKFLRGDGSWASLPASGGGGSPAVLTDTTDLVAWYAADEATNTVPANTGIITAFADKTGNGHTWTPSGGVLVKQYGGLAGLPVAFFATGITATSSITIPLKGAMTYWAIVKVTSTASYQNLFGPTLSPSQPSDLHLYWDQPSNKWQVDGGLTPNANVSGRWLGLVVHYFNSGGKMHFKVRENGVQILGDTTSTNGSNPIQGTGGSPVNYGFGLFRHPASALPFTSQILEWGFYAVSKDGTEGTLESYMRARAGTW